MKCPKMVTYINVTTLIAIGIILISVAIVKNEVIQNLITGSLSIITGGLNFIWANHWVCKVDTMICRTTTSPIMKVIAFVWIGYGVFLVVKTILAKSKNMPFQS
jgi:large-conductance mechanosensitive channel